MVTIITSTIFQNGETLSTEEESDVDSVDPLSDTLMKNAETQTEISYMFKIYSSQRKMNTFKQKGKTKLVKHVATQTYISYLPQVFSYRRKINTLKQKIKKTNIKIANMRGLINEFQKTVLAMEI